MRTNRLPSLAMALMPVLMAVLINSLVLSPAPASDETCIKCHLHSAFTEDFSATLNEVKTLAGFHGQVFKRRAPDSGCQGCHESRQTIGKLPSGKVCLGCHTRGKTAQGNPDAVFHAEEKHWPMDKVSCIACHKAHAPGNRIIKFLTTDAISTCQQCHKKSFSTIDTSVKTDAEMPTKKSNHRYGQNQTRGYRQ